MTYCPACGTEISPDSGFCTGCGKPLAAAAAPPRDRRLLVGAGVAAVIVLAAVVGLLVRSGDSADQTAKEPVSSSTTGSSSTTTTSATTTTTAPAPAVDPAAALTAYAARHAGSIASPVRLAVKTPVAMIAFGDTAIPLRFDGTRWVEEASLSLPYEVEPAAGPILAQDVTGDLRPDFGVLLGGTHGLGAVASNHGGRWRLVSFGEPDTIAQEDLRFKAGAVMTTDNPCEPSCAEGQHYDNTWRYDTAAGYFVTGPLGD